MSIYTIHINIVYVIYSLNISPHIRTMVYHTAVKYGGAEEWNFLWNRFSKSIDATERGKIMYALAGSREPYLIKT